MRKEPCSYLEQGISRRRENEKVQEASGLTNIGKSEEASVAAPK